MPLADGLGAYHRAIPCAAASSPWFDEGLRLYYAFDLEGAEHAFRRAAQGGSCAIAAWGVALALGHNLNVPAMPERRAAARAALPAAAGSPAERGLVDALRARYAGDDVAARDRAYADAMRALAARVPDDPDVAALTAEALLDLRPFAQWSPKGEPAPETPELVALLERGLRRWPDHPGLNHYYVHAMESSPHPERALAAAERIGAMMPAAGHLVHMPSHIYLRVGRYAEAAEQNRKAIVADRRWEEAGRAGPLYAMYPLHDHHFLWLATLVLGRAAEARAEADVLAAACAPAMLRAMPGMEPLLTAPVLTALRFGEHQRLLTIPAPPASDEWPFAAGIWHFARARAHAALGARDAARRELDALDALITALPVAPVRMMGANAAADVLRVAAGIARGDLLARSGDVPGAERLLRDAVAREDALRYDEPPSWPLPARQVLGRVLLDARRHADAAAIFEADLAAHPNDGWALLGLAAAWKGLGRPTGTVDARVRAAFAHADRMPSLSAL